MSGIEYFLFYYAAAIPVILSRATFLDWAFKKWGRVGGTAFSLAIMGGLLFLDWLQKRSKAPDSTSSQQDEDQPPPDSSPPSDEQ